MEDRETCKELKKLYDELATGTTPATVLLPWLPTPAMIKKLWATKSIYDIVTKAISDREQSGVHHNDTLQMLLDSSDDRLVVVGVRTYYILMLIFQSTNEVSQFIMGLVIAGARATGTTGDYRNFL